MVVMAYLLLLYRGLLLVYESQRTFGGLLASGLSIGIALQAFAHIGVVLGLVPTTGLTLPFVSMGGTSLVFTGIALGIILSVSKKEQEAPKAREFNRKNRFRSVAQTTDK